ncbi:PPPDE putative peptidase domain-containing protein [Haematococcus lacustris]
MPEDGDAEKPVQLWVYDISMGMARALSPMLLGTQVEGVWHTSVVVDNTEWVFGYGVHKAEPGTTLFGQPLQRVSLGSTHLPRSMILDLIRDLSLSRFRPEDYSLLTNNCNHFTNEVSLLLTGSGIPSHYLTQHEVLMRSPMGQMLLPMIQQMEGPLARVTADGLAFEPAPATSLPGSLGPQPPPPLGPDPGCSPTATATTTTTTTTTTLADTVASLTTCLAMDGSGRAVAASASAVAVPIDSRGQAGSNGSTTPIAAVMQSLPVSTANQESDAQLPRPQPAAGEAAAQPGPPAAVKVDAAAVNGLYTLE